MIPIVLVLFVSVLFYLPFVQRFVVGRTTLYIHEITGMQVELGQIRLSFPLDLTVKEVEVYTATHDTLTTLQELSVRINPFPLFRKIISVENIRLQELHLNTGSFIENLEIKGHIKEFSASMDYINPAKEQITLNRLYVAGADINLRIDSLSSQEETAPSALNWKLRLGKIDLEQFAFDLHMPTDSVHLHTYIDKGGLANGTVDLGLSRYTLKQFDLSRAFLSFDNNEESPLPGFDPSHIGISELNAAVRSIVYQDKEMRADIRSFSLKERSGFVLSSLEGELQSDSVAIHIPGLTLKTPDSELALTAVIPWNSLADQPEAELEAICTASIGKSDLWVFVPDLPIDFQKAFPDQPLTLRVEAKGNLASLDIPQVKMDLPGAFHLQASIETNNVLDTIRRSADVKMQIQTQDMDFALAYLPVMERDRFRIPSGMQLTGSVELQNQVYQALFDWMEDEANMRFAAHYHTLSQVYKADLQIENLEPVHFMPTDSIRWLTASVEVEGKGMDLYSSATQASLKIKIDSLQYKETALSDVVINGSFQESQAHLEVASHSPLAKVNLTVDGSIRQEEIQGMIILDADNIDLYGMHLMDTTFSTRFQLFAELRTDLKERNQVDVSLGNWEIRTADLRFRPKMLTLKARSDEDTTQVSLHTGDLGMVLTGNAGMNRMGEQFAEIAREVNRQLEEDSTIHIAGLRPTFPDMSLSVKAGRDNPVYELLRRSYISFTTVNLQAHTSAQEGIRMDAYVYALARDTFLLDTVRASIRTDSLGLQYAAEVIKNKYRQQLPFTAQAKGLLRNKYADIEILYTNHRKEIGVLLGMRARKESEGYTVQLYPEKPVIGFNTFDLNPDNYFRFKSMKEIEANIRLVGKENASLWFHSLDNGGVYPELHAEFSQLNLEKMTDGFAGLPEMRGIVSADLQYAPVEETFMVVADAHIDTFFYANGRVGEILLNMVYLPLEKEEHQVDVHFYHDRKEVAAATALYNASRKKENIEGRLGLTNLSLPMLNPFIPGSLARLSGILNGDMEIKGSATAPRLNGYMQLDTASVYLAMADTYLRIDNKRIEVKNSLLSFDKYAIYSVGDNPFVIDGNINLSDLSRATADLQMHAHNMQVFNAQKTKESLVYGKLFMDMETTLKGPLSGLVVRGDARLLGGTNVTYMLYESALTVQDRMDGLVTFTSFTDTLTVGRRNREQLTLGGVDLLMVLHIDPTVQFRVGLTPDESNFVEVEGGGDLSFQYTPQGDIVMNGRYTFSEGVVKYALPIIPLKEFNIHPDSYVQWDGEWMNPFIHLVATERMRATVIKNDNQYRRNFDVGIRVQERLENMQMAFIIDAVDDTQAKAELAALGEDERTRRAVYMMVTGSYLGSGSDVSNVNVDAVFGNFLMGEINNIAGDALKGVDIHIGLDTYESEGNTQRDLTFSFAKRFYNDRIRVSVGGKVATQANNQQAESFLDNLAAEYLLDAAGTKTIKLFYDRNYESLLEGEIIETGVGLVLRRKVLHLRELFDFRKKKVQPVSESPEEESQDVEPNNSGEDETTKE